MVNKSYNLIKPTVNDNLDAKQNNIQARSVNASNLKQLYKSTQFGYEYSFSTDNISTVPQITTQSSGNTMVSTHIWAQEGTASNALAGYDINNTGRMDSYTNRDIYAKSAWNIDHMGKNGNDDTNNIRFLFGFVRNSATNFDAQNLGSSRHFAVGFIGKYLTVSFGDGNGNGNFVRNTNINANSLGKENISFHWSASENTLRGYVGGKVPFDDAPDIKVSDDNVFSTTANQTIDSMFMCSNNGDGSEGVKIEPGGYNIIISEPYNK